MKKYFGKDFGKIFEKQYKPIDCSTNQQPAVQTNSMQYKPIAWTERIEEVFNIIEKLLKVEQNFWDLQKFLKFLKA